MSTRPQPMGYDHPAMDKYRAAWNTLRENTFVHNPSLSEYDHIYLRGIQGTWKVKQNHWANKGYCFPMMLVWDYDRIWGSFDLGFYKGILMVDHGPRGPPPEYSADNDDGDMELTYFDFTWRGTYTKMPDALINNPLITKGKINFGLATISGYFEGMLGIDFPDSRCNFEGIPLHGPRRVQRTLQSFIDEWNDLGVFDEEESIRLPTSTGTIARSAHSESRDEAEHHGPGPGQVNSDEEDEDEYDEEEDEDEYDDDEDDEDDDPEVVLRSFSGIYDISSETIAAEWPNKARFLTLRLHVDQDQSQIWGWFDMGICEGYLLMQSSPEDLAYGKCLEFDYRGLEDETGRSIRGTGEVTLSKSNRISGIFTGMYGNALGFEGKRKLMPGGISGRETWFYQNGWDDYGDVDY